MWLLIVSALIGLGSYLISFRSFLASDSAPTSPAAGPVPTRTHEPAVLSSCVSDMTRIRRGPGTRYETIGGLLSGMCLTILGRNEDASWVYIVSDDYQTGWVAVSALPDAGDISRVSLRDGSGIENSGRPTLTSAEIANGARAYLTQVAATNVAGTPFTRYVASCFEVADRIGDHITCRMERAYCDYLPALEGHPTFCSDRPYPDQTFTLVVYGEDWSDYDGQCLVVSGYLQIASGALQIQALKRDQVSNCN